jgi:hypothetical protein
VAVIGDSRFSFYECRNNGVTDITARCATCEDLVRNPVRRLVVSWLFRSLAAALVLGCAGLHLLAAAAMATMSGAYVLLMLAMSLACLHCAGHALLAPTRRSWILAAVMAAGMLAAHPLLGVLAAGQHHMTMPMPSYITAGIVLVPALSLCVAAAGAMATPRSG